MTYGTQIVVSCHKSCKVLRANMKQYSYLHLFIFMFVFMSGVHINHDTYVHTRVQSTGGRGVEGKIPSQTL